MATTIGTSTSQATANLFKNVRINQLSPTATTWLTDALTALDSKDVEKYTSFLSSNVEVIFNNGDFSMRGLDAVRAGLTNAWKGFGTVLHEELNIYGTDKNFAHEALNHYTTLDGRKVMIRAVAWIDRDEAGKIESLRVYNDQSPLRS